MGDRVRSAATRISVPGAVGSELFEFTGGGFGYNDNDDFVFRIRAQGGVAANAQKVLKSIGGVISLAFQQGDPYSGLEGPPGSAAERLRRQLN
jgi:hypothetical protein